MHIGITVLIVLAVVTAFQVLKLTIDSCIRHKEIREILERLENKPTA